MIKWSRQNVYFMLCLFGDAKEHGWMEVINLGTRLYLSTPIENRQFKTHQDKFEHFFAKAVNYGLVLKIETPYMRKIKDTQKTWQFDQKDYVYKLSEKGDMLLRQEQAEREGNAFYYNLFDRSVDGKYGVDRFAPLTSTDYGVKEKHSYKAKDLRKEYRKN